MVDNEAIQKTVGNYNLPASVASSIFGATRGSLYAKINEQTKGNLKHKIIAIHVESINDIWDIYFWLSEIFPRIEQVNKGSTKGCVYLDIKEALELDGLYLYSDQYNKAEIPKFIFIDSFLDNYSNTEDYFKLCVLLMRYVLNSTKFSSRCLAFSTKLSEADLIAKINQLPTNFSIVLRDLLLYISTEDTDERI